MRSSGSLMLLATLVLSAETKSSSTPTPTISQSGQAKGAASSGDNSTSSSSKPSTVSTSSVSSTFVPKASEQTVTSVPWQTTGSNPPIKGALSTYCYESPGPCTVRCASGDSACLSAASSVAAVCKPQWTAYQNASATWALSHYGNGSYTLTRTATDYVVSTIFPSYSTDLTEAFSNLYASAATYHPVYAFGSGVPSTVSAGYYTFTRKFALTDVRTLATMVTVFTDRDGTETVTEVDFEPVTTAGFPERPPACAVTQVDAVECQQCQISGGTVELYFWPPEDGVNGTTHRESTITKGPGLPRSTIVNGVTMVSPSVYISLHTVYASDVCSQVGGNHTQTVLAVDPDKVSTLFGARGAGYVPIDSARIDYHDLIGAVPASQYERNPACARFGCITLKNDYYRPILSIPPEIRNLDPAWAGCRLDLGGLYDPPVALQPVANIAQPTVPGDDPSPGPTADPGTSPADPSPQPTNTPPPTVHDPPTSNQPSVSAFPEQSPSPPPPAGPSSQPTPSPSPPQPAPQPKDPVQSDSKQDPSDPASPETPSQSQPSSQPQLQAHPQPTVPAPSDSNTVSPSSPQVSATPPDSSSQTPAAKPPTGQSQTEIGSGTGGSAGEGSIIASVIGLPGPDRTSATGSSSSTSSVRGSQTPFTPAPGIDGHGNSTGTTPSSEPITQYTSLAESGKNVPTMALLLALAGLVTMVP